MDKAPSNGCANSACFRKVAAMCDLAIPPRLAMKRIEDLLRQKMGLHAGRIGSGLIEHAVRSRMRDQGMTTLEAYLGLLLNSPMEWSALVELVSVTETWFFR